MTDWFNHDDYVAMCEELMEGCPDSWDGDEAFESILVRYVHHLRDEVQRLGGCLLPWCAITDGEWCDHGYLTPIEGVDVPDYSAAGQA